MAAKRYKLLPPGLDPDVVWIDANMEVTSPAFVREALSFCEEGIALHRHPRRDCIYEEAEASLGLESQGGKYDGQPIREQVAHYYARGHPAHWGLWACGTIAWNRKDLRARSLGFSWLAECERWSFQDQLSFPYVCRKLDIQPGSFPFDQIEGWRPTLFNRWLRIHPHL